MNNLKYILAQYVNGKKKKIFSKHSRFKDALSEFEFLLSEPVYFPKKYTWDSSKWESDLVLYGFKGKELNTFINPRGFKKTLVNKDQTIRIKRIEEYPVEEYFLWYSKKGKRRINVIDLFTIIHLKTEKVTIKSNLTTNKITFEYFENNDIDVFVLKNSDDAFRLYEIIKLFCNRKNIYEVLFFYEPSTKEKIELYDRIEEKLNLNRDYLIRPYTQ